MAEPELHYPPGAEPNPPAPEPQPEPTPETTPEPAPDTPPAPTPETPEPEAPVAPEVPLPKKPRSIYDDLKDRKQEVKDYRNVAVAALKAQGIEVTGKETPAELQSLMQTHKTPDAPTPPAPETPAPSQPSDELEAYAKENGLDAKELDRLAGLIAKRVPAAQLSEADRKELSDLKAWKADNEAKEQRAAEDNAIKAEAPNVKKLLDVHDDAELAAVMDEVVKLAHSERYHDKEVDYIVFREKEKLAKLVSPKKPSFENGGNAAGAEAAAEPDFSAGKGITPGMAQKASHEKRGSALEIRRAS